jgi:protein associated with RNAse G/E
MIVTAENTYQVCSYKHDGSVHRIWQKSMLVKRTDEYLALVNNSTLIQESDGRVWQSRDPAVTYFFKDQWYNVICMLRPSGIYYYCNIASPYVEKDNTILYIDYDLDLSLSPNDNLKVLDEIEYYQHAFEMEYPPKIDIITKSTLKSLMHKLMNREFPFSDEQVLECYQLFKEY